MTFLALTVTGYFDPTSQYEDVLTVFGLASAHRLSAAGGACDTNTALSRIMGALGGGLFGGYVNKALSLGIPKSRATLAAQLKSFGYDAQLQAAVAAIPAEARGVTEADGKSAAEMQLKVTAANSEGNLGHIKATDVAVSSQMLMLSEGAKANAVAALTSAVNQTSLVGAGAAQVAPAVVVSPDA